MGVGPNEYSVGVLSTGISQGNNNGKYAWQPAGQAAPPALPAPNGLGTGDRLIEQQPFLALSQGVLVEEQQQQSQHDQPAQHDPHLHLQTLQSQMQQLQQQVQEYASQKYPSLQQLGQWDQQMLTVEIQELQQLLHQKELVSQQLQLLVERHGGVQKGMGSTQQVVLDSGRWEGRAQPQEQRVQQAQLVSTGAQQMPMPQQQQAQQQQVEQQQTLWAMPLVELEECLEDIQHAQQQQQNHLYQQPKEQQFNQLLQECFQQVRHLQQLQQQQQPQQSQQSHLAGVQQQQQQQLLEKCFQQLHQLVQLQQGEQQVGCHPQQLLNAAAAADTHAGQCELPAGTAGTALAAGTPAAAATTAEWAMPTGPAAAARGGALVEAIAVAAAATAGAAGGAGPTMCAPACTSDWEVPGSSEVAAAAAASHSAGFSPWDLREISATLDDIFADCDLNSLRLMFRSDSMASGTAEMMQMAEFNSLGVLDFLHLEDLE